jgi:hypothetical protein
MQPTEFLKDKYLQMAQKEGLQNAVNQLHHDLWSLEQDCFDSPEGYQPEVWKILNEMRIFSRELWDLKLST